MDITAPWKGFASDGGLAVLLSQLAAGGAGWAPGQTALPSRSLQEGRSPSFAPRAVGSRWTPEGLWSPGLAGRTQSRGLGLHGAVGSSCPALPPGKDVVSALAQLLRPEGASAPFYGRPAPAASAGPPIGV